MKRFFLPLILITITSVFQYAKAQVSITPVSSQNITCNGGNDGYVNVNVVEGEPQYYQINGYYWSNGATTEDISGLTAGTYTLTATDNWAMSSTYSITLTQPDAFAANFIITGDTSTTGTHDGKAVPEITGGTPLYTYFWSTTATTDSLTGIANGSYSVTVTDSKSCVSQAFNFEVNLSTGVQNIKANNNFSMYPNPTTDYLTVIIPSSSITALEIMDMLGRSVYQQAVSDKQMSVNISQLMSGIYFTLLKSPDGIAGVERFVKE